MADSSRLSIADAHHHFWDFERLRYPWLEPGAGEFFLGDPAPLRRRFLPPDYRRETSRHRVVATVHVEAECARDAQVEETRWLTELHARYGLPSAIVAHAWFDTDDAQSVLEAHAAFPLVRGIRSKPVTARAPGESVTGAPRSLQDPRWLAGLARLAEFGFSWDLRVPFWHLGEAARVAAAHPDILVVLNHTGFPWDRSEAGLALWRRGMRALAAVPTVWVKLSCVCVPGAPWTLERHRDVVREAIDIFGVERCMFATNIPPDTLQVDANTMLDAYLAMVEDFPRTEREQLFAGNAARFYRLEGVL